MVFRKTTEQDLDQVMKIIKQAQEYFRNNHIDQWVNNYPSIETIKNDIANGYSYVLLKDGNIVATAAISFDEEVTYRSIYDGDWLSNSDYVVIHRIAVDNNYKGSGISAEIMKYVEQMCLKKAVNSIKIDTHEQNMSMQKFLEKNGFSYCGVIYLLDRSRRVAYEKILSTTND